MRVSGVNPVHISIYFTQISLQCHREGYSGSVGSSPAQGSDIAGLVNSLESGYHDNIIPGKLFLDSTGVYIRYSRLGVYAVGFYPGLRAG